MKFKSLFVLALCMPTSIAILDTDSDRLTELQEHCWTLSPDPVVQIGVAIGDPTQEFHRIAGTVRLSNGRIVVADGGSSEVRFYDASGSFIKAVGGKGGGPEEFERIMRLRLLRGDTLAVFDSPRRRVVKLDRDGQFVQGIQLYPAAGIPRVNVHRFFADGSMLGLGREASRSQTGFRMREYHLILYTPDGTDTKYLGSFPGAEIFTQYYEGLGYGDHQPLFGREAYFATGPGHFYHIWTGENTVNKYSQNGELVEVFSVDHAPQRVTDTDIQLAREAFLAIAKSPLGTKVLTDALEQLPPPPDFHNVFGWPAGEQNGPPLLVDDIGNVWVLTHQTPPGEFLDWTVLSETGEQICDVAIPRGLRPYHIGDDFVLGWMTDEDGVEYVRMYALSKEE